MILASALMWNKPYSHAQKLLPGCRAQHHEVQAILGH